jgi:uncharacterized protein (DUF488 family)
MELLTVGYEERSPAELQRVLRKHGVTRLVDVRERPFSRKRGFSAFALFETLRKVGITYELDPALGNPMTIRSLWKNGELNQGRTRYRNFLRNGRRGRVERLVKLAAIDRVAILCYEADSALCHRSVIAEEAVRLKPGLVVRHL